MHMESATRAAGFQTFEDLEAYHVSREFRKTMHGVSRPLPEHF